MAYTARGDLNTTNPKTPKGREEKREKEEAREGRLKEDKGDGRGLNYKTKNLSEIGESTEMEGGGLQVRSLPTHAGQYGYSAVTIRSYY